MAGSRLRIPGLDQLVIPDGSFLLLPLQEIEDRMGVHVSIAGDEVRATRRWRITRPAGITADAQIEMTGRRSQFSRIPRDDDVIEIRAGGPTGVLLFGGYIDAPKVRVTGGGAKLTLTMRAVGWRHRLNDRELTQSEGVDVLKLTTALAQLQALVALISGEGFTLAATLPTAGGEPFRGDMRFASIGVLMDEIAKLNDTIISVLPDRSITAVDRSLLTAPLELGWDLIEEIGFESTRQDYRTRQRVRAGRLVRLESHSGRADGRYRLGGVNNLNPAMSLFSPAVTVGDGVTWLDGPRGRGGAGRGSALEAVLLRTSDNPALLPPAVVTGGDRAIDLMSLRVSAFDTPLTETHVFGRASADAEAFGPLPTWNRAVFADAYLHGSLRGVEDWILDRARWGGVDLPGRMVISLQFTKSVNATTSEISDLVDRNDVSVIVVAGGVAHTAVQAAAAGNGDIDGTGRINIEIDSFVPAFDYTTDSGEVSIAVAFSSDALITETGLAFEGVFLTSAAESDLAVLAQASDGTEYGFLLSDMTPADDTAPYFWPLSVLTGLSDAADLQEAITKLRDGDSRLVIVDTTEPRIDFANRRLLATDELVELEVTSLDVVDVDGTEVSVGGGDDEWVWNIGLQELQQVPPAGVPPTTINVQYKGRHVSEASSGVAPFVDRSVVMEDLPQPADAVAFAQSQIDLHRRPRQVLIVKVKAGPGVILNEGDGVSFPQDVLDTFNVEGALASDVWRIDRVVIATEGLRIGYQLRLLRRSDESRFRDQWRAGVFTRQ